MAYVTAPAFAMPTNRCRWILVSKRGWKFPLNDDMYVKFERQFTPIDDHLMEIKENNLSFWNAGALLATVSINDYLLDLIESIHSQIERK